MVFDMSTLENGVELAKLSGRLDFLGTTAIDDQFALAVGGSKGSVIVDLSEITFLASIGMRMLILSAKALNNRGHKLVLLSPSSDVKASLVMVKLDELIPICDDMDAAMALIKEPVA